MTPHEQYLFDLQGFIAVPDALDAGQLAELNGILDEKIDGAMAPDATTHRFGFTMLDWGPAFRDLVDNPRIVPYLGANRRTAVPAGPRLRRHHPKGRRPHRHDPPRRRHTLRPPLLLHLRQPGDPVRPVRGRLQPEGREPRRRRLRLRARQPQKPTSASPTSGATSSPTSPSSAP